MADNTRQFTLVGNFTDNITGSLDTINSKLDGILKKLETYKTKVGEIATTTRDLGKAAKESADGFNALTTAVSGSAGAFKDYKKYLGQATRANRRGGYRLLGAAGRANDKTAIANAKAKGALLQSEAKAQVSLARAEQIAARTARIGGGGGGGGRVVGGRLIGDFVAADLITTAIKNGFQAGVSLMYKPFEAFSNAFTERVRDELSDVRTAGGLFSISKRQKNPFITSFREAELLTQTTNKYLAELAGTLPGPTQEYVQVGKQIADGIGSVVANNEKGAIALANVYAKEAGREEIVGTGPKAQQQAFTELTGELTKLTVLAGYGQAQRGPYGLPQIAERLVTDENVSLAQLQRYASIFRDPLVKGELERGIKDIQKFGKETPERLKAVIGVFRKIVTPELIARYRKTVDGIKEGFYTAFFEPETGLFGLGRKLVGVYGTARDEFGRVIKKEGQVQLALFEIIRDIISGFGIPVLEIVQLLPQIIEPFKEVGLSLINLRELSQNFLKTFYGFAKGYQQLADTLEKSGNKKLAKTLRGSGPARAAIETFANLLADFGALKDSDVSRISKQLTSGASLGPIIQDLFQGFFNSGLWQELGSAIGQAAGSFLDTLASIGENILGIGTGGAASPFIEGFRRGKGFDAISRLVIIISEAVVRLIIQVAKALVDAFAKSLLSGNFLAAAGIGVFGAGFASPLLGLLGGFGGRGRGGRGGGRGGRGGRGGSLFATLGFGPPALPGKGGLNRIPRRVRGGAAGGALAGLSTLAAGGTVGQAIGATAGGIIGGALLAGFGPVGVAIGSTAGSAIGEFVANSLDPATVAMNRAATALENSRKYGTRAAELGHAAGVTSYTGGGAGVKDLVQQLVNTGRLTQTQQTAFTESKYAENLSRLNTLTAQRANIEQQIENARTLNLKGLPELEAKKAALDAQIATASDKTIASWNKLDKATQEQITGAKGASRELISLQSAARNAALALSGFKLPNIGPQLPNPFGLIPGLVNVSPPTPVNSPKGNGTILTNNTFTINQLPGQDPESLASLVALKISNAVNDQRSSYFV